MNKLLVICIANRKCVQKSSKTETLNHYSDGYWLSIDII